MNPMRMIRIPYEVPVSALIVLTCVMSAPKAAFGQNSAESEPVRFNRDIRPILSDNCFYCHGPDKNHREAELRLDDRQAAIDAKVIAPGAPGESELIARISSADKDEVMPPPHANKKLNESQKALLARWIAEGAPYERHWAYEPPVKPAVPAGVNGIDFLVRKKLESAGLKPSLKADRRTLARRAFFDLIGLPPVPDKLEKFVADPDPKAYERLVDQLLRNAHFGERMAIGWLDAVRFADTIGYHSDNPRNVWPYRDWVIRSFNDNKPFDRFTIEQIAGDLLPEADTETHVGSAFNRLLLTTEEGGAQPMDYRARMLTDRVRAVGNVWLGQTTGCAQCHDHKYDPFTTRDFYRLGAFFADVREADVGRREDGMPVPRPEDESKLADLEHRIREIETRIEPQLNQEQIRWEAEITGSAERLKSLKPDDKATPAAKAEAKVVGEALKKARGDRSAKERETLQAYFRKAEALSHPEDRAELAKLKKERDALTATMPRCLVTTSDTPRVVRVLHRGDWQDETGEVVSAGFPSYLPQPDSNGRVPNRLDLAKWLVSRENPLTARVFVNRLMAQFFGHGISKVTDDLGTQGEPPVNPELLDWLACEFMDSGWDVKHIVRTIVTSETYQQVSTATDELRRIDPDNRLLARQSPLRLDAELVRDNALFVSGLLDMYIGGPSVKPYQPEGYWENLNFPVRSYDTDTGPAQHRRGLYVWWQRSFTHPAMLAFDAPSREECTAQRTRSNLPQQALVLLNDPTFVEASRGLANRILGDLPTASDDERITWAVRQVLQRKPDPDELKTMKSLLDRHRSHYADDTAAANAIAKAGQSPNRDGLAVQDIAVWTHIARVLFNLHETITRP
ncbi:DUF1553 domain-containing protein [bacterium]|nr:DUF1553 domain-containing protein [bacterium]